MSSESGMLAGVHYRWIDCGEGEPVLVLHGFTGTAGAMSEITGALARHRRVIAPDLVGHGGSEAPGELVHYQTDSMVKQLTELLDRADIGIVDVVGYSMGARLALSLATAHPDRVRKLALIGATAGIEDNQARAERRVDDERLADSIEATGVESFVDHWEALPLFATQLALPHRVRAGVRSTRLAQRPTGLANSLRGFGTGVMPHLWDDLHQLAKATMVIAGGLDERYVTVGERLVQEMPQAQLQVVPSVGHAVHVEAPGRCLELIEGFFAT